MKATVLRFLSVSAVALIGVAAVHAETYEGVHQITSERSRADVSAEATVAARAGNAYGDAVSSTVAPMLASSVDRSTVRAQAVAAAHDPLQNLDRKAFVNSVIPAQYTNGSLAVRQQDRQQAALQ